LAHHIWNIASYFSGEPLRVLFNQEVKLNKSFKKRVQVSGDTTSVIDTDTAVCGIAGIEYQVFGIAHHYLALNSQEHKQFSQISLNV
jgi:hypothetical protein